MLLAPHRLQRALCMASGALVFAAVSASAAENRSSPGPALSGRLPGSRGIVALNAQLVGDSAEDVTPVAVPVAVIDFDYQDTSGEPRNQSAEHHALMAEFMNKLRNDLAAEGKFAPVTIVCANPPCTIASMPPTALIAAAKEAGARLILCGGVHKMSTLIQWGKIQVFDLAADRLIDDKMLTFRGDTNEAWLRAEEFLVEEMRALDIAK